MQITVLAAQIGWERSRVSHHVRRMGARGLVTCGLSATDRRVTEVTLTRRGRQALEEAAPGHVDLVRRLFFDGLPTGLAGPLSEALESVHTTTPMPQAAEAHRRLESGTVHERIILTLE
jgi:DNA-binding MarR family transcriptional regulator